MTKMSANEKYRRFLEDYELAKIFNEEKKKAVEQAKNEERERITRLLEEWSPGFAEVILGLEAVPGY